MTPARKTLAILVLAALVAGASLFLSARKRSPRTGPSAAPTADAAGLELRARLESSHLLLGNHEAHVAVLIDAPVIAGAEKRPPVNLAVVIDRSGSMAGEKLAHARQAAQHLVEQLRSGDRFAVVVYGSDVQVVFPSSPADEATKAAAVRAIDGIMDEGGTNLSGGLTVGLQQIVDQAKAQAVSRIVLISDGLANEGIVDRNDLAEMAREIAQRGISITTVGVGLDFDERTMTRIAESGRGNYYFVESAAMLSELFATELDKMGATTGSEVRLSIAPNAGVQILEAYGYPMQLEGGRAIIPISDLHSGEQRKVVLRIAVDAKKVGGIDLGTIDLAFRPTGTHELARATVKWTAEVTDDMQIVLESRDREAVRHIERALTAKAIDDATQMYENGQQAAAMRLLDKRRRGNAKIAEEMGDMALSAEIGLATDTAGGNFAAAPAAPQSTGGKRAQKANRFDAFQLAR